MKSKTNNIFKVIALLICIALMLPFAAACAGKTSDAGADATSSSTETTAPVTEATTPEPTTPAPTEPPTTVAPTEPIDPNLPYYDYLDAEFARFGFTGGDRIIADTEQGIFDAQRTKGVCTRSPLDLTGEKVPFTVAFRYDITDVSVNMWDTAAEMNFSKDKTMAEGDIIAGCMYIRDAGGPNPSQVYLAFKTPTNNWGSEGNLSVNLIAPDKTWQKVYFYGFNAVDENPASNAVFEIFMGYDPGTVDIGGIYVMRYPATDANLAAAESMPY